YVEENYVVLAGVKPVKGGWTAFHYFNQMMFMGESFADEFDCVRVVFDYEYFSHCCLDWFK
ncbi:hypothetical protein, partial [Clostridioides difficile]|uniref:hypothetical protein n=1 Tax=Clostridioides difficile TaxID=1496 RepID=UPI001A9B4802